MRSVRPRQTGRSRLTSLAIAIALVAVACSSDAPSDLPDPEPSQTEQPSTIDNVTASPELACVTDDYACSWAEAEPGTLERTGNILAIAAALASTGESAAELAAAIEGAPDIASVSFDDFGVMFRVTGGVPVFVDIDPTGSGDLLSGGVQPPPGTVLPSLATGGVFTGCPGAEANTDNETGVALKAGDHKHALLLSPWQFGLPWDLGTLKSNLQLPGSRYRPETNGSGGSVTVKQTVQSGQSVTFPNGSNVVPSDFCGWEKYATIILMTHGRALCRTTDAGTLETCITSFSVGQFSESLPEITALVGTAEGVTIGVNQYGTWTETITDGERAACVAALEEVVFREGSTDGCFQRLVAPRFTVKVTTDFFSHNYPNGLPDRLIFLAACQGMKFGDMWTALGANVHGRGQILGFSKIALLSDAQWLLNDFTERIGENKRIGDDYKRSANRHLDDLQRNADLYDYPLSDGPGGELGDLDTSGQPTWGADVVSLASNGEELENGAEVTVAPSSGDTDSLLVTLLLSDVIDGETPEQYQVDLLWNDQVMDIGTPSWTEVGNDDMQAEVVVPLPRALEEEETFDLEIRGVLPAASDAPTRWKFTDLTAKIGTACDVLGDAHVSGALDVSMTRDEVGDYGQSFFGDFCSWSDAAESSQVTVLVTEGGAEGFRLDWEDSELAVDGFGDVATYDTETGRGVDCPSSTDPGTGEVQWICFVNLNVAVGDDVLYFTLSGNVVGENGPGVALDLLRDLVTTLREQLDGGR